MEDVPILTICERNALRLPTNMREAQIPKKAFEGIPDMELLMDSPDDFITLRELHVDHPVYIGVCATPHTHERALNIIKARGGRMLCEYKDGSAIKYTLWYTNTNNATHTKFELIGLTNPQLDLHVELE
jgi:hypothetical protein